MLFTKNEFDSISRFKFLFIFFLLFGGLGGYFYFKKIIGTNSYTTLMVNVLPIKVYIH